MKYISLMILFTGLLKMNVEGQNKNPCGLTWTGWNTAWNQSFGKVLYRLQFPTKGCSCGWKFVQMQHTLIHKARINLELEGYDCDDKYMKSSFDCDAVAGEICDDQGDWHSFKRVTGVVKVDIEFEDGKNRIRYVSSKSGTIKYINGMTEREYNQQQQKQKAAESQTNSSPNSTGSGNTGSNNRPSSVNGSSNRPNSGGSNTGNTGYGGSSGSSGNYGSGSSNGSNPQSEQERIRKEREEQVRKQQEAIQKQKEEQERQRQEAIRREQERYEEQLREITRKSEARAQTHATISQGVGAVFSIIMENQAKKGLANDDRKRRSALDNLKRKLATGEYELEDCETCKGDGYINCANCKNQGKYKCNACSGEGGKTCNICRGSGKQQWGTYSLACTNCIGTGTKQCIACNNAGESICAICHGRGERQCYCSGTGKKLKRKDKTEEASADYNVRKSETDLFIQNIRIDSAIFSTGQFPDRKRPDPEGTDSVYYLSYQRTYNETVLEAATVKIYKVYKYSDGTYPLLSSIYQKIKMEPSISHSFRACFFGYYDKETDVIKNINAMKSQAAKQGVKIICDEKIHTVNPRQFNIPKNDDFWNN